MVVISDWIVAVFEEHSIQIENKIIPINVYQ